MRTYAQSIIRLMQKPLFITVTLLANHNIQGQGTVRFSNVGLNAPVGTPCAPNGFTPAPAGTTFSVALYFAPPDQFNTAAQPDPSTMTQLGSAAFLVAPGIYDAGTRTANVSPPGGMGWFQARAWQTAYGGTYEQALANGASLIGVSAIIEISTGDPTPPATNAALLTGIGAISFFVDPQPPCVPEPSAALLCLLGGISLCLLPQKNRTA
jgi:hypothetical protein